MFFFFSIVVCNISIYMKILMKVYERELFYLSNWWIVLEFLFVIVWKLIEELVYNLDDIILYEIKERILF